MKLETLTPYQWLGGTEGPSAREAAGSLFVDQVATTAYEVWGPPLSDGGSEVRRALYQTAAPLVKGRLEHIAMVFDMVFDNLGASLWLGKP